MLLDRMSLCLAGLACLLSVDCLAADSPGLVKEKPATGTAIETSEGWMVPYEFTIPNTTVSIRMVPIPPGEFLMGSPEDETGRDEMEGPQRKVAVEPFWMAETEITWAQYKLFMNLYRSFKEFQSLRERTVTEDNMIDAITAPTPLYEPDFTFEFGDDDDQAAVSMTQYSAKQFTKWLSGISGQQYRLPTEAEWEYACRAGTKTRWYFGDDAGLLPEHAWFQDNMGDGGTKHVRQKKANPWGLFDMYGNAAEWVLDAYEPYKTGDQVIQAATDWIRSEKPYPRIVRGGSWEFSAEECRSASRLGSDDEAWKEYDPNLPNSPWWFTTDPARGVGFRPIRTLKTLDRTAMEEFWKIDCEDTRYDVEDRLSEGRGVLGLVDKSLPDAIRKLE